MIGVLNMRIEFLFPLFVSCYSKLCRRYRRLLREDFICCLSTKGERLHVAGLTTCCVQVQEKLPIDMGASTSYNLMGLHGLLRG
jgi:hypothetical protein